MRELWPQVLMVIGLFMAPVGIALATSGAALFGVAVFLLALAAILTGVATALIRFAIRRRLVPHLLAALVALLLMAFGLHNYWFSLSYVRGAHEEPAHLYLAALKGFSGQVYYVG